MYAFMASYVQQLDPNKITCMLQKRKLLRESWDYIKILKDREAKVKMAEETKN